MPLFMETTTWNFLQIRIPLRVTHIRPSLGTSHVCKKTKKRNPQYMEFTEDTESSSGYM